jgi:hypothetical protein
MSETVKQHMSSEVHDRLAAHHLEKAQHHDICAEQEDGLADCMKAAGMDKAAGHHKTIAESHRSMAAHHRGENKHHLGQSARLAASAKADADRDLNKIVPTNIHMVIPDASGIRAVPRGGQPMIPARANVPIEFSHLVKIEDE